MHTCPKACLLSLKHKHPLCLMSDMLSQKIGCDISWKFFIGDNSHEFSEPIFWEKEEKCFKMLSVDFFYLAC